MSRQQPRQSRPRPRVIETADLDAIVAAVHDHDLTSSEVGEWTGNIDGQPVVLRLVRPREVLRAQVEQAIRAATARLVTRTRARSRTGRGRSADHSPVERLLASARESRWW